MWNSGLLICPRGINCTKRCTWRVVILIVTATSGGDRCGEVLPQQHALWMGSLYSFHSSSRLFHEEHVSKTHTHTHKRIVPWVERTDTRGGGRS